MNTPAVTVLMPVYNAARYLKRSMDSILDQTFSEFEFLIIDDGSTDNTVSIVESYRDPRIRLVKNEANMGISATLNRGIALANCSLIARMDADDFSYPERLQKQYNYMMLHPECALLSTWVRVVSDDDLFIKLERYRSEFYYYNLTFECWMYHPTIMFRKEPIIKAGMYSKMYSEDYDLFWKVSSQFKIWNLAEPLVEYKIASTSLNLVLRKEEYDVANEGNVIRNLRYYMGENFSLSKPVLEGLRHNFVLLLQTGNINEMITCLNTLDAVTIQILAKENPNRNVFDIKRAHYFKKRFILEQLFKGLPKTKGLWLLLRANAWGLMIHLVYSGIQWRLTKLWRALFPKS